MVPQERFSGVRHTIRIHWPVYLIGFGGGILGCLLIIALGIWRGWYAFVPLALALMLVLFYFLTLSLWASYVQFDIRGNQDHHMLFEMGQLQPTDRFAHIHLGSRVTALGLSRRLISGRLTVIDVYNPQLTPSRALARMRKLRRHPPADPRLTWLDGSIDLLPLPDGSTKAATISRSLGEFWQPGDRQCLLKEVARILVPGGHLLIAEPTRSDTNTLVMGPAVLRLRPAKHWRRELVEAGFEIVEERTVRGLVHYWRADKPRYGAHRQLTFDFGI